MPDYMSLANKVYITRSNPVIINQIKIKKKIKIRAICSEIIEVIRSLFTAHSYTYITGIKICPFTTY